MATTRKKDVEELLKSEPIIKVLTNSGSEYSFKKKGEKHFLFKGEERLGSVITVLSGKQNKSLDVLYISGVDVKRIHTSPIKYIN